LRSPRKAQEVSPDHFTGTGVDDMNQAGQQKAATPALKQMPPAHVRNHQTDAPATLQLAATRDAALPAQPGTAAARKSARPPGATRKNNSKISSGRSSGVKEMWATRSPLRFMLR
jgi:hypothetical protein